MTWVFLSPHFDDIALSLGGLVWELAQSGETPAIWTICAADPPPGPLSAFAQSLHDRWGTPPAAVQQRREEDKASCRALGASSRYFSVPDCIYRPGSPANTHYYASEEAIFGPFDPREDTLAAQLADEMALILPENAQVVCPLTLGNHVDHQLTRAAAEKLDRVLWYYADYPYVLELTAGGPFEYTQEGRWESRVFPISDAGLRAWQASVAAHQSQVSTFWEDLDAMRVAIQSYSQAEGGVRLWKPV
jgi:LmbE family N-acetylglucosaminyl deacetylase